MLHGHASDSDNRCHLQSQERSLLPGPLAVSSRPRYLSQLLTQWARSMDVQVPELALRRADTGGETDLPGKVVSAMRKEFGSHQEKVS